MRGVSESSCSGQYSTASRPLRAVTLQIQHHDVVVGIDGAADLLERGAQVAHRGQRLVEHRARIVDQHDRAPVGVEAIVEQVARDHHVLAEDVFARVRREADEVEVGDVRPLVVEIFERLAEQRLLRGERGLGDGTHIRRIGGLHRRLGVPPRLVRPHRQRNGEEQQRRADKRARPEARAPRHQRRRDDAPVDKRRPQRDHHEADELDRVAEQRGARAGQGQQHAEHAQDRLAGERHHGNGEPQVRLPERGGQRQREQQQHRDHEAFEHQRVRREPHLRTGAQPVDQDADRDIDGDERHELAHADAKRQRAHWKPGREPGAARQIAAKVGQDTLHRRSAR